MDFTTDFRFFWCVSSMYCLKVITNLKFYKCCCIKDHLQSNFCVIWWYLVEGKKVNKHRPLPQEIHSLGPMDLKICSLERNPQQWIDSWQSLETFAKIISVTSISARHWVSTKLIWKGYALLSCCHRERQWNMCQPFTFTNVTTKQCFGWPRFGFPGPTTL